MSDLDEFDRFEAEMEAEEARAALKTPIEVEETNLPDGEYAIVEVLGHRTIVGRIEEVERFGAKLMSIEPIFQGKLLAAVLIGGGSIYQFTPCNREIAIARAPKQDWQLPASIRAAMPPVALPAPVVELEDEYEWETPSFLSDAG